MIFTIARLCRARADNGLLDLGDLVAGTNDGVTSLILGVTNVLVLTLGTLPDLDLAATTDDTNPHGGEEVVGSVRVEVDTTVEHGSSILADAALDQSPATGVLVDEVGDIVDNTGNSDQTAAVLSLLNVVVPLNNRELLKGNTPVELGALLIDLLLELLNTALLNLVGTELLEVGGEAELAPEPDGPLGRVVLVPLNGVAVVGGELVVEVVVTLTKSDESSDDVVPGAVAVVERLVTEPVGQRVDAEGGLLDEEDAEDTGIDEATHPVTPKETSNSRGEDETHEDDDLDVVLVLPDNDGVLVEVGDVGAADALGVLLHDHPAKMAVQEALADAVGVLGGVGVAVVSTVVTAPPADGALDGTAANSGEEDAQRQGGIVRLVCPETMVSGCDSETSPEVVDDGPSSGLPLQGGPEGGDAASERHSDDEDDLGRVLVCGRWGWGRAAVLTLSQLTCLYQLAFVMGVSVMCGFLGSYLELRLGSAVLAMGEPSSTNLGSMARSPETAW
jgi:hypothetical protein